MASLLRVMEARLGGGAGASSSWFPRLACLHLNELRQFAASVAGSPFSTVSILVSRWHTKPTKSTLSSRFAAEVVRIFDTNRQDC